MEKGFWKCVGALLLVFVTSYASIYLFVTSYKSMSLFLCVSKQMTQEIVARLPEHLHSGSMHVREKKLFSSELNGRYSDTQALKELRSKYRQMILAESGGFYCWKFRVSFRALGVLFRDIKKVDTAAVCKLH